MAEDDNKGTALALEDIYPLLDEVCADTLALPCGQNGQRRQTHSLYGLRAALDFDGREVLF